MTTSPTNAAGDLVTVPATLEFTYTNWRGKTALRRVWGDSIRFVYGSTEWHQEPQWLMSAMDADKGDFREFAVKDIVFAASPAHATGAAMRESPSLRDAFEEWAVRDHRAIEALPDEDRDDENGNYYVDDADNNCFIGWRECLRAALSSPAPEEIAALVNASRERDKARSGGLELMTLYELELAARKSAEAGRDKAEKEVRHERRAKEHAIARSHEWIGYARKLVARAEKAEQSRAALSSPAPEGEAAQGVEPVAWQWRMDAACKWDFIDDPQWYRERGGEVRALYPLAPPSVKQEEAGRG